MEKLCAKRLAPVDHGGGELRLSNVISQHNQYSEPNSLPDNIGDAYLLFSNPVFRNVRREVIALGYRFAHDEPHEYYSYPMMSLEKIISGKVVPFHANFPWLELLEARAPGRFGLRAVTTFNVKHNFLMHESAHCLAHHVFFGNKNPLDLEKNDETFFLYILGEAFANATETLSAIFITDEIGGFFHRAKSYQSLDLPKVAIALTSAREHGFEKTFRAIILYFLYSNFFYERIGEQEFQQILNAVGAHEGGNSIRQLSRFTEDFSETFRTDTSVLYLMGQGFSDAQIALLRENPLAWLSERKDFETFVNSCLDSLTKKIVSGIDCEFVW